MHYYTAVFASESKQCYWDEMIDRYLEDVLDHVEINGASVPTLPPTINAIYLFIHIYHHFLKEGIALRQFIDWMMFLEVKHDEIVVYTGIIKRSEHEVHSFFISHASPDSHLLVPSRVEVFGNTAHERCHAGGHTVAVAVGIAYTQAFLRS